jgi:hypothetical protein
LQLSRDEKKPVIVLGDLETGGTVKMEDASGARQFSDGTDDFVAVVSRSDLMVYRAEDGRGGLTLKPVIKTRIPETESGTTLRFVNCPGAGIKGLEFTRRDTNREAVIFSLDHKEWQPLALPAGFVCGLGGSVWSGWLFAQPLEGEIFGRKTQLPVYAMFQWKKDMTVQKAFMDIWAGGWNARSQGDLLRDRYLIFGAREGPLDVREKGMTTYLVLDSEKPGTAVGSFKIPALTDIRKAYSPKEDLFILLSQIYGDTARKDSVNERGEKIETKTWVVTRVTVPQGLNEKAGH